MCSGQELASEPAIAKRRRISIEEVEQELNAVGLSQPALSQLNVVVNGNARELRKRGQAFTDEKVALSFKRPRTCSQLLPLQTSDLGNVPSISVSAISLFAPPAPITTQLGPAATSAIVPVSRGHKIMFEAAENVFQAELPKALRPVLTLPRCERFVEVARVALDSRGVAYVWSEEGELLASMPPVQKQDVHHNADVQIKLLCGQEGRTDDCAIDDSTRQSSHETCSTHVEQEMLSSMQDADSDWAQKQDFEIENVGEFSPSTTVPNSPDCDMDMD
jgi:hypothetical protein